MEPLIIVHSRDGSCSRVAELLREHLAGGEVRLLQEAEKRRGVFGFLRSGFQSARERPSRLLGQPWNGVSPGRHLYLVGPIWAGRPSPAIRAFLLGAGAGDAETVAASLQDVPVHILTVQADPKRERSGEVHTALTALVSAAGGSVVETVGITGAAPGRTAEPDALREQVVARVGRSPGAPAG